MKIPLPTQPFSEQHSNVEIIPDEEDEPVQIAAAPPNLPEPQLSDAAVNALPDVGHDGATLYERLEARATRVRTYPGGTAIVLKRKFAVSDYRCEKFDEWHQKGRLCAAEVTISNSTFLVVALYGFAPSHPDRHTNEAFFTQISIWLNTLTIPVIWGGDFNATVVASPFLSLVRSLDLWRISPDTPSTRGRHALSSGKAPIDHILINSQMLDWSITCHCNQIEPISDHHAITGSFKPPCMPRPPSWRWPKPMILPEHPVHDIPWRFHGQTYAEWATCAVQWLHQTYEVKPITKIAITSAPRKELTKRPSARYVAIRKLRGYLVRLESSTDSPLWGKAIALLASFGYPPPDSVTQAHDSLQQLTTSMYP